MQFSAVVSDSLQSHRLQHARLPRPSPTPRVYSNSCPLSWWCHSTISSSVVPFSSHLQFFPASGSFPITQLFASGGQSRVWFLKNNNNWNIIALQRCVNFCCTTVWISCMYAYMSSLWSAAPVTSNAYLNIFTTDFTGSPEVTTALPLQGMRVRFLVGELTRNPVYHVACYSPPPNRNKHIDLSQ